jgi:hypothetical protein
MLNNFVSKLSIGPRFWLLLASAVAAFALSFVLIPDVPALAFVTNAGYWMVLLTFVFFVRALWLTFRPDVLGWSWRKADWATWAVIGGASVILMVHESFGFKILMDEIMLLGTSMSMHFDRTALTPIRGNDIQGTFVIINGMLDKRPLFFPFLESLLHDFTGYRPENVFVLNGVLTVIFLSLVNLTGRLLAGRLAGWIGVALFAGLPLLAQNATGGGFELLNLVMILATMLLGVRFVSARDEPSLTAFCFSGLLLAQVRYESVIYLLPVALTVFWVWWQQRRATVSWEVVCAPLLFIHYPLQHRIFDIRSSSWQLFSQPAYTKPFSFDYIPDNLGHALAFFFGRATDQPNSILLSALGVIATPFFLLLVLKRCRRLTQETPAVVATTIFAVGFVGQFVLMMCYFWGQFDDPIIRRLSLPTHLGFVVAILSILPQFSQGATLRVLLGISALAVQVQGVPSMAAHAYSQEYLPGRETAWRRAFIAEQPRRDYLVIDNDSILWIVHQVSSTPVEQARKRREAIIFNLRNRTFSDIYVFQRLNIDPATGKMAFREGDDLGPDFELETVREERLQTLTLTRMSRLKSIRDGGTIVRGSDTSAHPVPRDRATIDRLRHDYIDNFLKQLP